MCTVHCDISPKVLNDPFPLNLFGATLLPKICHTYPTMIKLGTVIRYTKKIQNIYEPRDTSLQFYWHQHFFNGNQQILLYQEIQIYIAFWYILSNSFSFLWVAGLLKIKVFWNKGYDIRISVHDVSNKILTRDSSYIVDVAMWPKFGNSGISMISYRNLNFIRIWREKTLFLRSGLGWSSIIWDWY